MNNEILLAGFVFLYRTLLVLLGTCLAIACPHLIKIYARAWFYKKPFPPFQTAGSLAWMGLALFYLLILGVVFWMNSLVLHPALGIGIGALAAAYLFLELPVPKFLRKITAHVTA